MDFIATNNFRVSSSSARIVLRSSNRSRVNAPCFRAFWFPNGAPDPAAPPCMRQRGLPRTAGAEQAKPLRVPAPQRGLAIIARVLRM
ncbi:hypothetical protein JQ566_00825 [Bradyrhizobium japonicum]|nr:hypothetical protein [Bradyrhizobium japonicum]